MTGIKKHNTSSGVPGRWGGTLKPFAPGVSGNPSGRPKSVLKPKQIKDGLKPLEWREHEHKLFTSIGSPFEYTIYPHFTRSVWVCAETGVENIGEYRLLKEAQAAAFDHYSNKVQKLFKA